MGPDGPASPLLRRRLAAQLLAGPRARDCSAVARRLLAIQGQDPRGARLAIRARTRGVTGADVDRALTQERTLVLTWLNRGTLHLVAAEDYPLLQALAAPPVRTANATRLGQEGVGADAAGAGVRIIDRALADDGPLTGPALRERLSAAGALGPGTGPQALVHLLIRASLDGAIVRGPMIGAEHAYARVADWLPAAAGEVAALAADRDRALAELARRFLAGHGPAEDRDLARWSGLGLRDARAGLAAIGGELRERPGGLVELARRARPAGRVGRPGRESRARPAGRDRLPPPPPPRLLGAFEPLLMGWCSRAEVLGDHAADVVTGGIFRGFALVGGRAAGVWRFRGAGITLDPFDELDPKVAEALEREETAILRFLGRG